LARLRDGGDHFAMNAAHDPMLERRRHRSDDALSALTRLLEAARARAGLDALAVADTAGLLVAGAGASQTCEELAAWAPVVAHAPANDADAAASAPFAGRTSLRRLCVGGSEIVVVACLGTARTAAEELDAVSAGCQRILSPAGV
jgi:hypothetical protein